MDVQAVIFGYLNGLEVCRIIIRINKQFNQFFDHSNRNNLVKTILSYDFGTFELIKYGEEYKQLNYDNLRSKYKQNLQLIKKAYNLNDEWTYNKDEFIFRKNPIFLLKKKKNLYSKKTKKKIGFFVFCKNFY